MKKQQGSALILAILLLAFFMALSLNMLTISRAKAQRAGDTVIELANGGIDTVQSSITYTGNL